MAGVVQELEWDTSFFGVPIGRVDLDGATAESLRATEAEGRALGLACLYGSLDPGDASATVVVQDAGFRFVEAATTFSLRTDEPEIPSVPGVTVRIGTAADLPAVEPASVALAPWSRFAVDPRFGIDAALRLQQAWIERAARCDTGERQLVVAERGSEIVALITRCTSPVPVVDTVWATRRGSGAARQLIQDSREWAGDRRLLGGPIAARNVLALRYVSHCGYRVLKVRYVYHLWLD